MSKLYYICKYTPIELLESMGAECVLLDGMVTSFSEAERAGHPNLCGYGKAIIEKVLSVGIKELVLVNCCDTIRSVYDILHAKGDMDFLYFCDLVHDESSCGADRMAFELKKLYKAYKEYSGNDISPELFAKSFHTSDAPGENYIGILGARTGKDLENMIAESLSLPVRNLTCVSGRSVGKPDYLSESSGSGCGVEASAAKSHMDINAESARNAKKEASTDALFSSYAKVLINQTPCMRMNDITARRSLVNDPHLKGIVYHTIKFCDYYGFEYSDLRKHSDVPILKLETDYTLQSAGQLSTRLEAFAEQLAAGAGVFTGTDVSNAFGTAKTGSFSTTNTSNTFDAAKEQSLMKDAYFAGIDSGSTSTKAVIIDKNGKIVSTAILPTGAKVADSSKAALAEAIRKACISEADIAGTVTTGYGRKTVGISGKSVTEISCHAKGAHALDNNIRTIIDIGGQDSKVISVDENGNVASFAMNDKCAAGTGRFLEMTGRTLGLSLEELSTRGIDWKEDIAISNTCTVFAESEIISLVADNKSVDDIVHGLNRSVAVKVSSLMKRTGAVPAFMMTGGVAANRSVVKAIEELLGAEVRTSPYAQLCGAYGAALYARG